MNQDNLLLVGVIQEKRNQSVLNKLRRFLNNYWLIPVIIVYLQFYTAIYPLSLSLYNDPIKVLEEKNVSFLKGASFLYKLTTNNFPYSFIGHTKEVIIRKSYDMNINQIPHSDIVTAFNDHYTKIMIRDIIMKSRNVKNTEVGGILSVSYEHGVPKVNIYEIPSANGSLSDKMHHIINYPEEFIKIISNKENSDFIKKFGLNNRWTDELVYLLSETKIKNNEKRMLINSFITTYDLISESNYILYPLDYKSFIGEININGSYLGFFHFHNGFNEPPSEVDIGRSFDERQIVFTLSEDGFIIYDIVKGVQQIEAFTVAS